MTSITWNGEASGFCLRWGEGGRELMCCLLMDVFRSGRTVIDRSHGTPPYIQAIRFPSPSEEQPTYPRQSRCSLIDIRSVRFSCLVKRSRCCMLHPARKRGTWASRMGARVSTLEALLSSLRQPPIAKRTKRKMSVRVGHGNMLAATTIG